MPETVLTKTRLRAGVWQGHLTFGGAPDRPSIAAFHREEELEGLTLDPIPEAEGHWVVRLPIPAHILSDGVQTIVIRDLSADAPLATVSIVAGEPLEEDFRAELELLRAELDMLKRAFRRHCLETL
jgi:hypothetical protein